MLEGRAERSSENAQSQSGTIVMAAAIAALAAGAADAKTLKWGANREIVSLDPYSYGDTFTLAVLNHVYEGLVRYNDKLEIEPALATSWELTSPTVWRFKLRQGVTFHDGAPFTADDVLASLERVSHPTSPLKGNLPAYKAAKKVDDHTIDIEVTDTYPLLLNDLTNIYIFSGPWLIKNNATLPTDAGKGVEGYPTNNANGTGPFKVESRKPDAATIFVVNPKWWDKPRHNLTRIEFLPIASAATRVAALLSGEVDFTNVAPLQDLPRLAASPDVKVLQTNELRTIFFAFNMRDELTESDVKGKNPFKDKQVREALYRAIDIDALQRRAMRGLSRNTGALVAPAIPGYAPEQDKRLPFDAEGGEEAAGRGRLSERLLVQSELHERRLRERGGDLPGGGLDVGARRPEAERRDRAALDPDAEAHEGRVRRRHARLGQ